MLLASIKTGFKKGLDTTWLLAKIIIPVYFTITILKYTPVIDWIAYLFNPLMALFNLPGEAAIILVLGNVLNLYAAVGAIKAVSLTPLEITTIALMLSFSHSLFVETAVTKRLGVSSLKVVLIRIGLAIVAGVVIGRLGVLV